MSKFICSYFEQYLFRGDQFSEAGLNGALMKRKNNTKSNNRYKKIWEQLSIAKVLEAHFGLDLKCLFRPNPNLFKSCSLLRARGNVHVPDLGSAEPEGALVLSSGGRFQEVKNNAKTIKPSGQNWSQWLMRGRRLSEVVIIGF